MRSGRALATALLLAALLFVTNAGPAAAESAGRLVLAFYYNWFDENSWAANAVPDQPASHYVSRDRGAMGRQIDQAKSAGIDALVVNWWGPQADNQTEINLRAMLDEAAIRGFHVAVDVDLNSPYLHTASEIQAAMDHLLNDLVHRGAYLRVGGKPVVFFYHQNDRLSTSAWGNLRAGVDKDHNSLWIEEGVDVSPLSVFDGHHLYSVTWNPPTDLGYTANKFARLVRGQAAALGAAKIYVATVMPGYNDLKTGRGNAFATDREGGAYYERSWQAAIASSPDWIVITSFNEWPEGTYIEPSQAFGNRYLELTAKWAGAFHTAAPPPPTVAPTPPPVPAAPVAIQPAPETNTAPVVESEVQPTPERDRRMELRQERLMTRWMA